MKRLHVHVAVKELEQAINFYNTLFNQQATVVKDDYAKWLLDDPAINFAISDRGNQPGLNHLGFQVDNDDELEEISQRLEKANIDTLADLDAQCCYAHSDKYWTKDPAGIPWENFHTLADVPTYYGEVGEANGEVPSSERCCN